MKNIIHILAGKANPNTLNGVNKVVDSLATEQTKMGLDTMVVGVANNTEIRHSPIYKYYLFHRSKNPFKYPASLLQFLLNNSDSHTIFHFHSVFIFWYLPLIRALKSSGRKRIFLTPHGQYVDPPMKTFKKTLFFNFLDAKILREVEAVHIIGCVTEDNKYVRSNANRIVCIPNGFGGQDQKTSTYETRTTLVFSYLGRLENKQKGLDLLIPAFIKYIEEGGIGVLKLAGSGPDEKSLIQLSHNAKERIDFLGPLFNEDKWRYLRASSVLISPSRWEGIPTGCLEAASVGCPLIVTKETNLASYIIKYGCGLIIDQLSVDSIVSCLFEFEKRFFDQDNVNAMRNASIRMIREELNWTSIAERVQTQLYNGK